EVDDFLGNALNMSVRPTKVRLALEDGKLAVKTVEDGESIFKFDVREDGGRHEVDFASAGNDLELRGLIDVLGGIFTSSNTNGFGLSEDAPTVRDISQDNDTVVVDLLHTVSQVILGYDLFGRPYIRQRISEHPGKVLVRLWLKRQKSLPSLPASLRK